MLAAEWFAEQRRANEDRSQLVAWLCSRRAGKTRSRCRGMVRKALKTRGGRFLYLNSTRGEAERLAWHGLKNDGMAAIALELQKQGIPSKIDNSDLEIHFPEPIDSRIFLRGADDETELRKALGYAYHEVWWDEAQKIPPKLTQSIREVLMPALLDFGGQLTLTGTPVRQMSGLFYEVTRPEVAKRMPGWSLHHWTLLQNTFFGHVRPGRDGRFEVVGKSGKVSSRHEAYRDAEKAAQALRWRDGVLDLQRLFGGESVAPIDGPIMQREAFGKWVREDSNYVYTFNRLKESEYLYAPHRRRVDGYIDLEAALADLPFHWTEALFALGADLGYSPDPFAMVLWAWHPEHPQLYEVVSYEQTGLRYEKQAAHLMQIRDRVVVGIPVADAGGGGKPAVAGWSEDWSARYGVPLLEAEKHHKHDFIELMNHDIDRGWVKLRDGSPLHQTATELQWATVVTANGKLVEDPTMPNHTTDAGLYAWRTSFNFRFRPPPPPPPEEGTPEWAEREQAAMEAFLYGEDEAYD